MSSDHLRCIRVWDSSTCSQNFVTKMNDRRKIMTVKDKSVGSIGAKSEKLSDTILPKIILDPSTVNFSVHVIFSLDSSRSLDLLLTWLTTQHGKDIQHHSLGCASLWWVSPARLVHMRCCPLRSRHTSRSASCCRRRSTAAALTATQHALSLLQRKPVIYSLLYILSSRRDTREYSWDGTLPHWRNLCTTACLPLSLSLSLSLSLCLSLSLPPSLSLIFWGWV